MSRHHVQERSLAAEKLDRQRERLENRLYRGMSNAVALRSFVLSSLTTDQTINNQNFTTFASTLPNVEKTVLGLQLAPDAIIRYVFPESDSVLLGVNLLNITKDNGTVQRAIVDRRMIVDGPRLLSQGNQGLVARLPIFMSNNQFWGFSTVVLDFDRLAIESELNVVVNGLRLAIRGKDGRGSTGEVFFGDAELFSLDSIRQDINFHNGNWQIAGIPVSGWSGYWPGRNLFLAASISLSLLISTLIWRNAQHKYQLSLNEKLLRALASEDSLTKLANRRTLQNHLDVEWKRAVRMKNTLALLMIDIDYFKDYNDHYGHLEGDKCLCLIANTIKAAAKRPADLAARFGGEEFVLVLPDTTLDSALNVAEKLRLDILAQKIDRDDAAPMDYVTVSIGVASSNPSAEVEVGMGMGMGMGMGVEQRSRHSTRLLLEEADKRLYRAKAKGRNRAEAADV